MRIIEILEILQKYGINKDYPFWAEHDTIGFDVNYEEISEEDMEALEKLGVFYDYDYDGLVIYT